MAVFAGINTVVMAALSTSFKDLEDSWIEEERKTSLKTSCSKNWNNNMCFLVFCAVDVQI